MAREHVIDSTRVHHAWDNSLEPSLRIDPGDVVHFDLAMAGRGQVHKGSGYEDASFDFDTLYNLLGPVYVEGARRGHTLEVEVISLEPGEWGWTVVMPELGLLPDDFPEPFLRTFDLTSGSHVELTDGVRLPMRPFLGTMGTAPDDPPTASVFPPHKGGGNIDTRHLVAGSRLSLPVWCEGALFSCGDPHAAQGDGEVCVSAVECDMKASLRFELRRQSIPGPRFFVPKSADADHGARGYIGTMGIGPDLMQGARDAVRGMIALLGSDYGLNRQDAYLLCSLAGNLKIFEIVDAGVWNVGMTLPLEVME